MKHVYDKGRSAFKYTPVAEQTADYLRKRFDQIRAEIEANRKEADAKVKPIVRMKNGTR